MKKFLPLATLALGLLSPLQGADSLLDAIKEGEPTFQLRLRYESVDTDPNTDKYALLARTAIGYKTGSYKGFSSYMQLEDVSTLANEDAYYPTILDPEGGDVNMSYLQYENGSISVIAGRQTIIHDKARHIGNVGWRMNDQTYDAVTGKYTDGSFSFSLSYIWQVNRITAIEDDSENILARGEYKASIGLFSAYYYGLDFETTNAGFGDAVDSDTYGLRLNGSQKSFLYTAEFASQSDGSDNATKYDADYIHAMLGYKFELVTLKVGYESLGSDNGTASFSTPLATVHAYNGWSDRTLSLTPAMNANGIIDTYLSLGGKVGGVKLLGTYRTLESDFGGTDLGKETDLLAIYKTKPGVVLGAKAAMFDSDTANNDTTKFWIWSEYKL
jgi:hypothetical protein